jgi:hypothetical protein
MRRCIPVLSVALVAFAADAGAQSAHDPLIAKHASAHGVPEVLVRRVIRIESRGDPSLVRKGNYGLMQIRLSTARAMGYSGSPQGLLDPDTNLTYAVKYLAGAYRAAGCNADRAISNYQHGRFRSGPKLASTVAKSASAPPRPASAPPTPLPLAKPDPAVVETKREAAPKQVVAKVEPEPVAAPPLPRAKPAAAPAPAMAESRQETAPAKGLANAEPEAIPPPPEKKVDARNTPKRELRKAKRSSQKQERAGKKADAPFNLLAYLRDLVTPDKKRQQADRRASRKRQPAQR